MNTEFSQFPSVFCRPDGYRNGTGPFRRDTSGERESSTHAHGSRAAAMVRLGRIEFMVAVVDGHRRRESVYIRYHAYYSYRRPTAFFVVGGWEKAFPPELLYTESC